MNLRERDCDWPPSEFNLARTPSGRPMTDDDKLPLPARDESLRITPALSIFGNLGKYSPAFEADGPALVGVIVGPLVELTGN